MVNLFLYGSIELFLIVRDKAVLVLPDRLAVLKEEFFPETEIPRVEGTDASNPSHLVLSPEARIPEYAVFVELYYSPKTKSLLADLRLLTLLFAVVEEVAVLARVKLISKKA